MEKVKNINGNDPGRTTWNPNNDGNPYAIGCEIIDKATAKINQLGISVNLDLDSCNFIRNAVEIPYKGGKFIFDELKDTLVFDE